MAFKFKLQPVLDHRKTLEEEAQRSFSEVQASIQQLENEQRSIQQDLAARRMEINQSMTSGGSFHMRELMENWIRSQQHRGTEIIRSIDTLGVELESRRKLLVEAVQAREVMESLYDEELKTWQLEEKRTEQKMFDEIAVREFFMEKKHAAESAKDSAEAERIAS